MLALPIHRAVRFVLVSPHYPENLGAACRAIKTMGFSDLGIVKPGRLATPTHPMAQKMAVKSADVLGAVTVFDNLDEATVGFDIVIGTTARRGVSGVVNPVQIAQRAVGLAEQGKRLCFLFGNEKSGLTSAEVDRCDLRLRIPLAAPQPSLNLAQCVQVVSYQLFQQALDKREDKSRQEACCS